MWKAVSLDTCEQRQLKSALCRRCSSVALPAAAVQYAISGPPDRGASAGDTNAMAYAATAAQGRSEQEALRLFSDKKPFSVSLKRCRRRASGLFWGLSKGTCLADGVYLQ